MPLKPILSTREAQSVLVTAAEGGINYWASEIEYKQTREMDIQRVGYEAFIQNLSGLHFDDVEGASGKPSYTVSVKDVQKAADLVVHEKLANLEVLTSIVGDDIDATAADVIVQVAAFGKLIYG